MADGLTIIVEPPLPEIEVVLSEVGLAGPAGKVSQEDIDNVVGQVVEILDDGPSLTLLYENAKV